ncbi:hypothetical protein Aperf_G00000032777 [Anoplocephala perfoliata]
MQEEGNEALKRSNSCGLDSSYSRTILFPVQDNAIGGRLFRWYYQYFRRPDDTLIVLSTVEPSLQMQKAGVTPYDPLVEAAMVEGRNIVRRFIQRAHEHKVHCRGVVQLDINPGPNIVRTARDRGVDIILMCPRGNMSDESEKTEFDSVTEYVLQNCPNITLVIVPLSTGVKRARRDSFYKEYIDHFM